jgi:hypothetical protein
LPWTWALVAVLVAVPVFFLLVIYFKALTRLCRIFLFFIIYSWLLLVSSRIFYV